ncbi:MAG: thiamine-phosphate kinase [Pantoea sp. Brub]|nr:thiamine-phosphate kinase [Pantoea sp. Brub]
MIIDEFEIINNFFNFKIKKYQKNLKLGIGDDCALIDIPKGHLLATSTDTLISNIHFFNDINPIDLAYKAVAVNLSDLAAMGAEPYWITLSITLPKIEKLWLKKFTSSFFEILNIYNMQLIGGDTNRGPLSLTLNIFGTIPKGLQITRSGAKVGDLIYVTGNLGNSAAGFNLLKNKLNINNSMLYKFLINSHLRPIPRILEGKALRSIASASIDISDGLISDLHHILSHSNCGANIDLNNIPLSTYLTDNFEENQILDWALNGGEDYELCFTIPKNNKSKLDAKFNKYNFNYTCIGTILPKSYGLNFFKNGKLVQLHNRGFNHFNHHFTNIN